MARGRYENTKESFVEINRTSKDGRRDGGFTKLTTTVYNEVPERDDDVLITTQEGDRLDILSQQFYNTPHYWWFIARVNNLKSNNLKPGLQLRVPITLENAKGF
tara:strand:- start:2253 stop:2564 length:312 start_codon:yes stop_codon:yes gene_type:complete